MPSLAAVAMVALTVALGNWQVRRAHEKGILQQRFDMLSREPPVDLGGVMVDASVLDGRRVTARGRWLPHSIIFLDNRIYHGAPGYYVFMPLQLEDSALNVLVNRGWIGAFPERSRLPKVLTPKVVVSLEGRGRAPRGKAFELSPDSATGKVWQDVSVERFRDVFGLNLQPIVVEQTTTVDDGLVREWARPDFGIEKHRGYAFQWFSLAVLTVVLYVVLVLRGVKKHGA